MSITEAGIMLTQRTPAASSPPASEAKQTMEEIGRADVRARVAPDGTRWCRCCDHTAPPGRKSAYCPDHSAARNLFMKALRNQERREAATAAAAARAAAADQRPAVPDGMRLVEEAALNHILRMANVMSSHVMRASEPYQALGQPVWLDNLMLSAKNLDAAIQTGIANGEVLPVQKVSARPARRS